MHKFMRNLIIAILFLSLNSCQKHDGSKKDSVKKSEKPLDKFEKTELQVLEESNVGKVFVYDFTHNTDCKKSKIKYLGIVNVSNIEYKIMTSFLVTGESCRGSSSIKIYDLENNYFGEYPVGLPEDLPDELKEDKLLFSQKDTQCSRRKNYTISLEKELPKEIFIPCTESGGDLYSLVTEK